MAELLTFPLSKSAARAAEKQEHDLGRTPADAAAREQALDPRISCVVEAPAGSGKTGLLMQRFLKLLADPGTTRPESVLAITFTRKATAELRERIFSQLGAAAAGAPHPDTASPFEQKTRQLARSVLQRSEELGWDLLRHPRRLRVQTIDALCAEVAAALPLSSGSVARQPVDDADPLYHEAAQRTLRQLGGADRRLHAALETVLLHRDARLNDVEGLLASMLAAREQWAEIVPLDRESLRDEVLDGEVRLRLERTLETVVCSGLSRALKLVPEPALAELAALAHRYANEPGYKGAESPISLCHAHPGPPAVEAAHLDHWRALIGMLLTKGCGWRASLSHNHLGFKLSSADETRLKALVSELQCEPLREALEEVRCLPPAKYPDDQWKVARALFQLLLHALAELRVLFAERGQCDFTELSLAARHVLATQAGEVAAVLGGALQHLLVDEMQDTSSAQYDLLLLLTRQWDGGSQTVFLVGDPKQSIYLFRQARVERFLRTAREQRLGEVPLRFLHLTTNFRSRPELVEGVNQDFKRLFHSAGQPGGAASEDVAFVEGSSARPSSALPAGVRWHTRILEVGRATEGRESEAERGFAEELGDTATAGRSYAENHSASAGLRLVAAAENDATTRPDAAADADRPALPPLDGEGSGRSSEQEDALVIRRVVERWQATPNPRGEPWRIAVLARTRQHLDAVTAEFRRSGAGGSPIAYRAVQVERLGERQEVLDAFALARALHHPADRTAWWAVLRAPWCGLSAADLLALAGEDASGEGTVPELLSRVPASVSRTGAQLLHRALPVLQAAIEQAGRTPLPNRVERTWLSLGGDAPLDAEQRGNVQRFFRLMTEQFEADGVFRAGALRDGLSKLYAERTVDPGAVELMTIHGAKGLEWDVVFVPGLGRQGRSDPPRLLNWLELESGPDPSVLLAPIQARGDVKSPLYQWLDGVHRRRRDAEQRRLLYVACTRAREELHLFGTVGKGKAELAVEPRSLLRSCWAAAEPHFAAQAEALLRGLQHAVPADTTHEPSLETGARAGAGAAERRPAVGLALAASAAASAAAAPASRGLSSALGDTNRYRPQLTRLPHGFDPGQRFREAAARRLPYTPAAELPSSAVLDRPEGAYAVRALGNVVHRFLELLAARLLSTPADELQRELPAWTGRLAASLRGEGLAPEAVARGAAQAMRLLRNTLADPVGVWLLSPQPAAASEQALASGAGLLRVDRRFLGGVGPGAEGTDTLWIVDFKTSEPGGLAPERFAEAERTTYGPQLARYAAVFRAQEEGAPATRVELGLYYPAVPRLIHWSAVEEPAQG